MPEWQLPFSIGDTRYGAKKECVFSSRFTIANLGMVEL